MPVSLGLREFMEAALPFLRRFVAAFSNLGFPPAEKEEEADSEKREYHEGHGDANADLRPG